MRKAFLLSMMAHAWVDLPKEMIAHLKGAGRDDRQRATGFPNASTNAWIFVFLPPARKPDVLVFI